MYARIENGEVVEYPIHDIRARLPNISLPVEITSSSLPDGFVMVRYESAPSHNANTHKAVLSGVPECVQGDWVLRYTLSQLDEDELFQVRVVLEKSVRSERNSRLSASDWTQIEDAPVDKAAWAAYRQALRDVSLQPDFPFAVTWPSTPGGA